MDTQEGVEPFPILFRKRPLSSGPLKIGLSGNTKLGKDSMLYRESFQLATSTTLFFHKVMCQCVNSQEERLNIKLSFPKMKILYC